MVTKMNKKSICFIIAIMLSVLCSACTSGPKISTNSQVTRTNMESAQHEVLPEQSVKHAKNIPVLMYHSISEEKDNDAVISRELFAEQMQYLYQHRYYTASLDELYDHLTGKKALPEKSVVLTFDDGYEDTYTMPILKQYNFRSVVFVPIAHIGVNLTVNQLKEMKQAGMDIASHSYSHNDLGKMSDDDQQREIVESKEKLDKLFSQDTKYFCFPNGSYNETTLRMLMQKGFEMSFTIDPGWVKPKDNLLLLKRVWIGNRVDLKHFEERLTKENYSIL